MIRLAGTREGSAPHPTGGSYWYSQLRLATDGRVEIARTNDLGVGNQASPSEICWDVPEASRDEHEALIAQIGPLLGDYLDATTDGERARIHQTVSITIGQHYDLVDRTWPNAAARGVTRAVAWAQFWDGINGVLDREFAKLPPAVHLTYPAPGEPVQVWAGDYLYAEIGTSITDMPAGGKPVTLWARSLRAAIKEAQTVPVAA